VIHGARSHGADEDSLELTGSLGSEVIERLWLELLSNIVTLDVELRVSERRSPASSPRPRRAPGAGNGRRADRS